MGNFRSNASGGRGGFGGGRPRSGGGFGGRSSGGFGGGRSFGGSRGGFGERRGPMEMHDATCSKCAKACQVPFKPTGNKPVLCSDCFRNSGDPRGNARDFSPRGNAGSNSNAGVTAEQFSKINGKLDKIIKILEELEVIPEEEAEAEDLDEEESSETSEGNLINDSSDDEDDDEDFDEEAPKSA